MSGGIVLLMNLIWKVFLWSVKFLSCSSSLFVGQIGDNFYLYSSWSISRKVYVLSTSKSDHNLQFVLSSVPVVHNSDTARAECETEHDAGALQCHQQDLQLGTVDDGHGYGDGGHV